MRIAVMGAGGIGGYVGGRLAQAGQEVALIARGAHLAALQRDGLKIETPAGVEAIPGVRAFASPDELAAALGPVDLILFTVKLGDAEAAAATLAPLLGPRTRVLTLLNGIDCPEILARHIGAERVVAGTITIAAYIKAPGTIVHPGGVHRILADRCGGDPVVAELLALDAAVKELDLAGSDDPKRMLWTKFVGLAAFSAVTCATRSPVGRIYANPPALALYRQLLEENLAVAAAEGVPFPADQAEKTIGMFRNQPYGQKSSMLVDLEAGKPLELPWLSARICDLAARHGIEVPASRTVVAALSPFVAGRPDDGF